jgi:hypothetical protein
MKNSCPICESELSKKWRSPLCGNGNHMSHVLWNCGVCGATFTRSELQAAVKPPLVDSTLLALSQASVSDPIAKTGAEDPRPVAEVIGKPMMICQRKS